MIPRFYQRKAISSGLFSWEEYNRSLITVGTGGGKTVIGAKIIKECLPSKCLWIADQNELCSQPMRIISAAAGVIPALEKSDRRASRDAAVVVASSQTLARQKRREEWPKDHFDYIFQDECHRRVDITAEILSHFETAKVIGFTATPFRKHLRDLSEWFETVAYSMPLCGINGKKGLIQLGFAPPMQVLTLPVEIDLQNVKLAQVGGEKDYDANSLDTTIEPYYDEICKLLKEHASKRRIIVFLPLIKSSQAFVRIAQKNGFTAQHVDGKSPDREEILQGFSENRFQMLCNSNLVTTGVDIPGADCYVNLTPTRSRVKYEQSVGRVSRVLPGVIDDLPEEHQVAERKQRIQESEKPCFQVIDFLYQHDELTMHAGHLVAENEEDARAIFERSKEKLAPQDLEKLQKWVQQQKEEALVKRIEHASRKIHGDHFDPEIIGMLTNDKSIMAYDPVSRWELGAPTEPQAALLAKFGMDREKVGTAGMASLLIGRVMSRIDQGLATLKQLRALHNLGFSTLEIDDLSISEASRILDSAYGGRKRAA